MEKLSALPSKPKGLERSRKVREGMKELQDKPTINQISRLITEKNKGRVPIQKRWEMEVNRKKMRLENLKIKFGLRKQEEDRELTFTPRINSRSKNMTRKPLDRNVGSSPFSFLIVWIFRVRVAYMLFE